MWSNGNSISASQPLSLLNCTENSAVGKPSAQHTAEPGKLLQAHSSQRNPSHPSLSQGH